MTHLLAARRVVCLLVVGLMGAGVPPGRSADGPASEGRSGPIAARYPEDLHHQESFTAAAVHVTVRDARRQPIKGAEVVAYSEDWGARFPTGESPVAVTNDAGTATFKVMRGRCSFFAGCGREYAAQHPGEGYFLALPDQTITGDTACTLEPSCRTLVRLPGDANEVYAMEAGHVPLLALPFCGVSADSTLALYSNRGLTCEALFVGFPPQGGAGYVLRSRFSTSGAQVVLPSDPRLFHRIRFTAQGPDDAPAAITIGMAFPQLVQDHRRTWQLMAFQVTGQADMLISPMTVNYYGTYGSGEYSYWLKRRSLDLKAGQTTDERFGGSWTARVLASNDFTSFEATNLWFFASDRHGHILDFYRRGGKAPTISVELYDRGGTLVHAEEWTHAGTSLGARVKKAYAVADGLYYKVDWDLGALGRFPLEGKLIDDRTKYGWCQVHTPQFDGYFPLGYEALGKVVLDRLEKAYAHMREYVGQALPTKLKVSTPVAPPSAGIAGGDCIWMWLDGFLWYNPSDQTNNWEACLLHELGHHMEAFCATAGAPLGGERNEALASLLAYEALGALRGMPRGAAHGPSDLQWCSNAHYENSWLPKRVCGEFGPDDPSYALLMIRFPLMVYLPRLYGVDIHRRFFRNWVNCRRLLTDFTEEEAFVTTYSFLCRRNLARLFAFIGCKVTPSRVYDGLGILEARRYTEVQVAGR